MEQKKFERLVSKAISMLPPIAKSAMENVAFIVESEVREAKANEMHIKNGELLLGLYEGIPQTSRGSGYFGVLPDKITIFKHPIEMLSRGDIKELKNIIFNVVRHEFGHHLGFSEFDIQMYEEKLKKKRIKKNCKNL